MLTQREYLVSLDKAKPGRGKFSNEAKAILAKAVEGGMTFKSVAISKSPGIVLKATDKPNGVESVEPSSFSPKAVRKWAKAQGIDVAARGRIHGDIVRQYLGDVPDAPSRVVETNPAQDYRPHADRYRMADRWTATHKGEMIDKSYKDVCNHCGYSIGWCFCPDGPVAYAKDVTTLVHLNPSGV